MGGTFPPSLCGATGAPRGATRHSRTWAQLALATGERNMTTFVWTTVAARGTSRQSPREGDTTTFVWPTRAPRGTRWRSSWERETRHQAGLVTGERNTTAFVWPSGLHFADAAAAVFVTCKRGICSFELLHATYYLQHPFRGDSQIASARGAPSFQISNSMDVDKPKLSIPIAQKPKRHCQ